MKQVLDIALQLLLFDHQDALFLLELFDLSKVIIDGRVGHL